MKNRFKKWMRDVENKSPNTAYQYVHSIDRISEHYRENTGKSLDIYTESNLALLKNLEYEYGLSGRYSDFGNYGNGTIRNAIATYIRFLEYIKVGQELEDSELEHFTEGEIMDDNSEDNIVSNNYNFTYERDLKNSLIYQVEELFSGYKIFGSHQEGIEYSIKGKRIDLLLENLEKNILLAIELKAGTADYRVFGQISMYLGLLSKRFPDREIRGLIIAGEIDETLKDACLISDKIELKTYKMRLILEDIH